MLIGDRIGRLRVNLRAHLLFVTKTEVQDGDGEERMLMYLLLVLDFALIEPAG